MTMYACMYSCKMQNHIHRHQLTLSIPLSPDHHHLVALFDWFPVNFCCHSILASIIFSKLNGHRKSASYRYRFVLICWVSLVQASMNRTPLTILSSALQQCFANLILCSLKKFNTGQRFPCNHLLVRGFLQVTMKAAFRICPFFFPVLK